MRGLFVLALVLCVSIAGSARGAGRLGAGAALRVVFVRDPCGHYLSNGNCSGGEPDHPYLMSVRLDGGGAARIFAPPLGADVDQSDNGTSISADGSRLSYTDKDGWIRVGGADGRGSRRLVRGWDADISADGSWIVYTGGEGPTAGLWTMRTDGSRRQHLALPTRAAMAYHPVWSPDRSAILYSDADTNTLEILPRTGPAVAVAPGAFDDTLLPTWSPDGRWIVFRETPESPSAGTGIYLVHPDGSDLHLVEAGFQVAAGWSPDGSKLAIAGDQLRIIDTAGHLIRRLEPCPSRCPPQVWAPDKDQRVSWSPDGRWIAFEIRHYPRNQIRVESVDGLHTRTITNRLANEIVGWTRSVPGHESFS